MEKYFENLVSTYNKYLDQGIVCDYFRIGRYMKVDLLSAHSHKQEGWNLMKFDV